VQQAAEAAGGLVCSKCWRKAAQLLAAQLAEAEALAAQQAEELPTAEALAEWQEDSATETLLADQQAWLADQQAAIMAEADPETDAGQAWLAAQQAAEAEKQAAAVAEALARADALGITAEVAAEAEQQRQQKQAEALTAEALAGYPTVERFAISANVFLDDRGYAVERTIKRNVGRADLLQAFSSLVGQPQLSRLAAYADGMG
jgi:hypothetical protein